MWHEQSIEVAPLAGAWIEIMGLSPSNLSNIVAPLAGAWIEILGKSERTVRDMSLPSRERGLKFYCLISNIKEITVAPLAGAWIEMRSCRK